MQFLEATVLSCINLVQIEIVINSLTPLLIVFNGCKQLLSKTGCTAVKTIKRPARVRLIDSGFKSHNIHIFSMFLAKPIAKPQNQEGTSIRISLNSVKLFPVQNFAKKQNELKPFRLFCFDSNTILPRWTRHVLTVLILTILHSNRQCDGENAKIQNKIML